MHGYGIDVRNVAKYVCHCCLLKVETDGVRRSYFRDFKEKLIWGSSLFHVEHMYLAKGTKRDDWKTVPHKPEQKWVWLVRLYSYILYTFPLNP